MGAALLSDQERAKDILKTLVNNVKIPVTCKIRYKSKIFINFLNYCNVKIINHCV